MGDTLFLVGCSAFPSSTGYRLTNRIYPGANTGATVLVIYFTFVHAGWLNFCT